MSGDRRHILIIGGGSELQPRLRATAGGVRTSVLCRASVLPWVQKLGENAAVVIVPDEAPPEVWVRHARALHAIDPFDGLTSLAEIDQDKAAAVAEDLGLDYHSRATIGWVHDKALMRRRLREKGVEDVPNALAHHPDEVRACAAAWGYPLILKPSRGRASTGVSTVLGPEDVAAAFARSSGASAPRLDPSPLVVEPLLQGKEISVEALSDRGEHIVVAVVDKHKDDATKVELGHVVPAPFDEATEEAIRAHIARVFDALEIRFGITHTELILTADGPRMVETHVRQAGDSITELVHDALDVDMAAYLLEQIAGLPIAERLKAQLAASRPRRRGAAIWFTCLDAVGELLEVQGVEEARSCPGIRDLGVILQPGAAVTPLISSYSRAAFARTAADDGGEALRLAQEASRRLRFHVAVRDRAPAAGA